ncbi:MAG TPA: glycosyl transferase family 1, partial [Candidatus Omnitrophica bacterium]|nr:glycosyl transferase family 1 [Candidatus Omnitrophota bacterium]
MREKGIDAYRPIVGDEVIDELYLLGEKLKDVSIQNINSTTLGGGVAEILSRMGPLMQELGVNVWWDVIKGKEDFFEITKKIHNALHGVEANLKNKDFNYFLEV